MAQRAPWSLSLVPPNNQSRLHISVVFAEKLLLFLCLGSAQGEAQAQSVGQPMRGSQL